MLRNLSKQKKQCMKMISLNSMVMLIFFSYFLYTYAFHRVELDVLANMITVSPLFFHRYEYLIESFLFLRERALNKNMNLT